MSRDVGISRIDAVKISYLFMFLILFTLNSLTPLIADDYAYAFSWATSEKIGSILEVFPSQYAHWLLWGGRSVAHAFAQVFIFLPKAYFNLLNSFIYCLFLFLCTKHILGQDRSHELPILWGLNLYFWFFLPAYGQVFLWLTGSCNYLWTTTMILLFLLPYNLSVKGASENHPSFHSFFMLIFGILAGWSNENSGAAVLFILVAYTIYKVLINKVSLKTWEIIGITGFLIGYTLLIVAPGNYARYDAVGYSNSILIRVFQGLNRSAFAFFKPAIILPILLFLPLGSRLWKMRKKSELFTLFVYLFGSFSAVFAMIAAPGLPDRAMMISYAFSAILLGMVVLEYVKIDGFIPFIKLDLSSIKGKKIFRISMYLLIIATFMFSSVLPALRSTVSFYVKTAFRNQIILEGKNSSTEIEVGIIVPIDRHVASYGLNDVSKDSEHWVNIHMAKHFSVDSIKGTDEHAWWPSPEIMLETLLSPRAKND